MKIFGAALDPEGMFSLARCETALVPENQNHFSLDD
jgi:hypothetical protein